MPTQDDILDVMGLAKSINSEIHEFNRNNMDAKTNINIITPQNALKDVHITPSQTPMVQRPPTLPQQMVQLDGMSLPATVTAPLISLAEAFPDGKIPEEYTQKMVAPPAGNATPSQAQVSPAPPKDQMEFGFMERIGTKTDTVKMIEQRFDDLEQKVAILDGKLTKILNILSTKKRRRKEESNESDGTVA